MIQKLLLCIIVTLTLYGSEHFFDVKQAQVITYRVEVLTNNDERNYGTAVALSSDGKLITAFHVIDDYKSINLIAHSGKEYNATIGNVSQKNDLAFLHIDAKDIPYAQLTGQKRLGQRVYILSYDDILLSADIAQIKSTGIVLNLDTKPGTSGGGVFDEKNNLVAILLREDILHDTSFAVSVDQLSSVKEPYRVYVDKNALAVSKNYNTAYCHDEHDLVIWNKLAKSSNLKVQELHALFLGLCTKVEQHDLTTDQAQLIFENAKKRLLQN